MVREAVVTLFGGGTLDSDEAAARRAQTRRSREWLTERIVARGLSVLGLRRVVGTLAERNR